MLDQENSLISLISLSKWTLGNEKMNLCSSSVFSISTRTSFLPLLLQADPDLSALFKHMLRSEDSLWLWGGWSSTILSRVLLQDRTLHNHHEEEVHLRQCCILMAKTSWWGHKWRPPPHSRHSFSWCSASERVAHFGQSQGFRQWVSMAELTLQFCKKINK